MDQQQIKKPNPFKQGHGDDTKDIEGWNLDSLKSSVADVGRAHYALEKRKEQEKAELAAKRRKRVVNGLEKYEEYRDKPGQCGCWS